MTRFALRCAFVLSLTCAVGLGQRPACVHGQDVTVDVVGISMAKLDPESEYGWSIVQGRNPGTEVHIRLSARGNTILSLGSADARGGDQPRLMTVEGQALKPPRGGADFDFFSQISEDGQHCVFPLRSEELPPAGANQLKMAGKVKLTTGMDLQTKRVKMDVVKDAKVEVGEIRLTLSEVEDDMFGENAWLLTFQSSQSLATIKEIKFFSDGGAEIESSSAGSHSFGFGNQMTYGRSFRVMGKPASLQVEVRYYASTKEVEVPLEMTFELNLNR